MKQLLLIVIVLALVSSTISCIPTQPPTLAPTPEPTPSPTPTPTPAPTPTAVSLDILSHSSYTKYKSYVSWPSGKRYKGRFLHIVGEFQNPSSVHVRLDKDKIEVTFYDAGGSTIDADFVLKHAFAREAVLAPGQKWPFRLVVVNEEASKRVASYELLAKGHQTSEVPDEVEVLSHGLFQNANLKLLGEVKNTTNENIQVRRIATFYDEKGTVIAADVFFPGVAIVLGPGEKAPFSLLPVPREVPGETERSEVIARWEVSDTAPYREFEILNLVYQEGPKWAGPQYRVEGEVKNSGKQSVTSVWVYATYYDAEGKVIYYSLSHVEPDTLAPGDKGSFELRAPPPPWVWEISNYALLVKSTPLEKEK